MKRVRMPILGLAMVSGVSIAAPFDTCPSKAYLFQGKPVEVYGVNLVSGTSALLSNNVGMTGNINAVGFNFTDRYIYGFNTTDFKVVRLGKDFQAEALNVVGLPDDKTFFVGDVFNHTYYLYRKGTGLFSIDLSPLSNDPSAELTAELITATATIALTDFAVNPVNNRLYGIDNGSGELFEFDLLSGSSSSVGLTGELGTFGAGYFDVNGNYYVSRNQDGQIYRIALGDEGDIETGNVPAVKFADGPFSNQNDGARCANAPVIDEDSTIDFGDAPDSYMTTLASNGPRHELDGNTWLGVNQPDGDNGLIEAPFSDDTLGLNDEEGAAVVTALEAGLDAIINLYANSSGYASIWIDWNADGDFADVGEKVITDERLTEGMNPLVIAVPIDASQSDSWMRVRFSQQTGLDYFGGAQSGEVEDHSVSIVAAETSIRHFPSAGSYVTLAYEDTWPLTDDYDLNDLVVRYRVSETLKSDKVAKSSISGKFVAVGADYRNGFAVRIPGVSPDNINLQTSRLFINGRLQENVNLEQGTDDASFVISHDTFLTVATDCAFFHTQIACQQGSEATFSLHINYIDPLLQTTIGAFPYDPFIFATENRYHGALFDELPGRSLEIHLADRAPTKKFNQAYFDLQADDDSDPQQGKYFKTENNLPWAILIADEWQWPQEGIDLLQAYPAFKPYCESGGEQRVDWFEAVNAVANKIYK
ncbi:LruC domain-containing protein [Thaumasiovibrio sp. DFM-14]|uniref:LruC domain-containing protein n=1 Tax=Thaumasiovibrio sp. DFM-14 TaxID=3384792 RepID=UPI0039A10287